MPDTDAAGFMLSVCSEFASTLLSILLYLSWLQILNMWFYFALGNLLCYTSRVTIRYCYLHYVCVIIKDYIHMPLIITLTSEPIFFIEQLSHSFCGFASCSSDEVLKS